MGKSSVNGLFSIAMLNNQRVCFPEFKTSRLERLQLGTTFQVEVCLNHFHTSNLCMEVYFGDPMVRFLILKSYVKKQIGTVKFLQITYSAFERHA